MTLPQLPLRDSCELGLLKPRYKTHGPAASHIEQATPDCRSVPFKATHAFCVVPVPPAGLEPTHPTGRRILSALCLPIPPRRQKKKGSGNKHERQPRDHSAPNQRDTRTPAAPSASPTRVRGHSQPAHPDRPNLLTNTESTLAQTPKRHPHTPSAPPMPPHPLRDSTRSREHPRVVSAPRSA